MSDPSGGISRRRTHCPSCETRLPEDAAFCPSCGMATGPRFCQQCGTGLGANDRFCLSCGAPTSDVASTRQPPPVSSGMGQAQSQIATAASQLTQSPLIALALVAAGLLGGVVLIIRWGIGATSLSEVVRFLASAGAPLALIAFLDTPKVSIEHRLGFSIGAGVIASSRGAMWALQALADGYGWERVLFFLSGGAMIAGGALLLLSVVPQLPPLNSVWSISTSGYLLAPGVLLGLSLIWIGSADSIFWFIDGSNGAVELLRSVVIAAVAVAGSIVLRPLRQGLSAAIAFIALGGFLSVVPNLIWRGRLEVIQPVQGLIALGLCAALVFLPDVIGGQSPTADGAATIATAPNTVSAQNEVAPATLPADPLPPEAGRSETVAAAAENAEVTNPQVPESPDVNDEGPTTIDAPPPTGPRRD